MVFKNLILFFTLELLSIWRCMQKRREYYIRIVFNYSENIVLEYFAIGRIDGTLEFYMMEVGSGIWSAK